jgi:dihydropteroate synthase
MGQSDVVRTQVMGIVNVTPDSFSDGGRFRHIDDAVTHGMQLVAEGADIIDVGGESTRPGAEPVDPAEECDRTLPVIRELAARGVTVSIDTRHAVTAERAMAAGARIINDVTGFVDPSLVRVAAATQARIVISHMPTDDPRTMQAHAEYGDVVGEVCQFLAHRIEACRAAGIVDIVVDPGIGFGKTTEHNLALLAALDRLGDLGRPVLVGVSRKRFIGELAQDAPPTERLGGTIAAGLAAVVHGASILRVHDVAAHVQALRVWHAIAAVQRT